MFLFFLISRVLSDEDSETDFYTVFNTVKNMEYTQTLEVPSYYSAHEYTFYERTPNKILIKFAGRSLRLYIKAKNSPHFVYVTFIADQKDYYVPLMQIHLYGNIFFDAQSPCQVNTYFIPENPKVLPVAYFNSSSPAIGYFDERRAPKYHNILTDIRGAPPSTTIERPTVTTGEKISILNYKDVTFHPFVSMEDATYYKHYKPPPPTPPPPPPTQSPLPTPTLLPTAQETAHETPFITADLTPEGMPYETPLETPLETASETPLETPLETAYETPFITADLTPEGMPYETPLETVYETPFLTASETPNETRIQNISDIIDEYDNQTKRNENVYDGLSYITTRHEEIKKYFKDTKATVICDENRLNYMVVAVNSTIEVKSDLLCQVSVYGRNNEINADGPIAFLIYADTSYLTEEFDLSKPKGHPLWRVLGSNNAFKTKFVGQATQDYSIAWYGFDGKGTDFPKLGPNMNFENIINGDIINMMSFESVSANRELEAKNFIKLSIKSGAKPPKKQLSLVVIVNIVGAISVVLTLAIIFLAFKFVCKEDES